MGLLSFLLRRDSFGHPFSIMYKGSAKFTTLPGAILTIMMQGLLVIYLVQKIVQLV